MTNLDTPITAPKYSKDFWIDVADRSISSFAGAAVAVLSAGGIGLLQVDLLSIVSVAGMAGLVSVLKAFAVAR